MCVLFESKVVYCNYGLKLKYGKRAYFSRFTLSFGVVSAVLSWHEIMEVADSPRVCRQLR